MLVAGALGEVPLGRLVAPAGEVDDRDAALAGRGHERRLGLPGDVHGADLGEAVEDRGEHLLVGGLLDDDGDAVGVGEEVLAAPRRCSGS